MEMKQLLIKFNILLLFFLVGCGGDSGRATQSVLPTPVVTYTPGEIVTDNQGYRLSKNCPQKFQTILLKFVKVESQTMKKLKSTQILVQMLFWLVRV